MIKDLTYSLYFHIQTGRGEAYRAKSNQGAVNGNPTNKIQ